MLAEFFSILLQAVFKPVLLVGPCLRFILIQSQFACGYEGIHLADLSLVSIFF